MEINRPFPVGPIDIHQFRSTIMLTSLPPSPLRPLPIPSTSLSIARTLTSLSTRVGGGTEGE
ncbi:hypothetical protein C1H46_030575 [Malus baccata]|uniref:Uncharacterized protein n=1 Tax=Malus baccata TaxID=106549 RepID=A0A540LBM4_MALBA|nr:hypothetical protein C1H46_030575 [Malus baccata]